MYSKYLSLMRLEGASAACVSSRRNGYRVHKLTFELLFRLVSPSSLSQASEYRIFRGRSLWKAGIKCYLPDEFLASEVAALAPSGWSVCVRASRP